MFGLCYENDKNNSSVTVYSDWLKSIMAVVLMCLFPFGFFLIPYFGLLTKIILFVVAAIFVYSFLSEKRSIIWDQATKKIPLFVINKHGIIPILTRSGLSLNEEVVKWGDIAEIFIYKVPLLYVSETVIDTNKSDLTFIQPNKDEAGVRYLGINLRFNDEANSEHTSQLIIVPHLQVMKPNTNDFDILLTIAHPSQKSLIKWLHYYHQQYLKQKNKI